MPIYIKGIQNISSAIWNAVYIPECKRNFKRPYFKAKENFQIAFSKEKYGNIKYSFDKNFEDLNNNENEWDIPEPTPPILNRRITYFLMGCVYSLPLINAIVYVALNRFQPRNEYRVLTYEEVIERARDKFRNHRDSLKILERIGKRLEDCHYKEDVKIGKRPQIDLIESDSYKTGIIIGSFNYGRKKNKINYEAIKFIHHLPKMHIASVPEYYYEK